YQIFCEVLDTGDAPNEMNDDVEHATPIELGEVQQHSFFHSMDIDYLVFEITEEGSYAIQTYGSVDPYVTLYSEQQYLITEDDDSGEDTNSLIEINLEPGIYYLHVESAVYDDMGNYRIEVRNQQ
ncbi:MAG: hypothetical protein PF447_15165, partial [Spirochaetaceae bacterium]|nr:hypothetical protein [Spirochaetaceae bacterium]